MSGNPSEPLVSILIPACNAEEWIADTIRSAMGQTWKNKEIIIVDDGSTDRTFEVAQGFESEMLRVVSQRRQGAASARNKAFSLCRGDYIQWLDADDLLASDKIALQMKLAMECGNARTLFSSEWGKFIYRPRLAKFIPTEIWCDLPPREWLIRKASGNVFLQTACWLVSRELTEAAGPWNPNLLSDDDGEYFSRVLMASDYVRFVAGAKVYYRGPGTAFQSLSYIGHSTAKIEAHWRSMLLHISYLRGMEDSQRVREACVRYIQTSLLYFFPERPDIVKHAEEVAKELGGELRTPSLSWKYAWMQRWFGWRIAKYCQRLLVKARWKTEKSLDHTQFRIEKLEAGIKGRVFSVARRAYGGYQRIVARSAYRRPFVVRPRVPVISFSFDDFPRSALLSGGAILESMGLAGTYYVSLGLMGKRSETGELLEPEDLQRAIEGGHELGCHTFSHCNAWDTNPSDFENEVIKNRQAIKDINPEISFKSLSYPIGIPRATTKKKASRYFSCCRGGGQTFNSGKSDLNYLSAYFIEQSREDPEAIKRMIDQNCNAGGWLIFATHDVAENPTPWGCTPELFRDIVQYSVASGARILPVSAAYESLKAESSLSQADLAQPLIQQ